jgi:hypothetical protein
MSLLYYLVVLLLLALSFGIQELIPVIEFAQQARVLLPPVLFFSSALSVSFPVMLFLALFTGLVWDARHLPYRAEKEKAEAPTSELVATQGVANVTEARAQGMGVLPVGYSIILFAVTGTLMQGIRPLFKRGRWELPVVMVGVATLVWLLVEFLLMSFLRGSFEFHPGLWTKLVTNTLLAMLVSPVLLFLLHSLQKIFHYEVRNEGFTSLRYGG